MLGHVRGRVRREPPPARKWCRPCLNILDFGQELASPGINENAYDDSLELARVSEGQNDLSLHRLQRTAMASIR